MGLLDRLPGDGNRGVLVALATGVAALLAAGLLATHTWGGDDPAPTAAATRDDGLVRVVSRPGRFALAVPEQLRGEKVGPHLRLSRPDGSMVVTVGPGPQGALEPAHAAAVDGVRGSYPDVRVERAVPTTMAGTDARRTVGSLERADGVQLVFSVTTTARGPRTWSVVMFADRDVTPRQLRRWYQPVLDGFTVLR